MRFAKTIWQSSLRLRGLAACFVAAVWVVVRDAEAGLKLKEQVATVARKIKLAADGKPVELDFSEADLNWKCVE